MASGGASDDLTVDVYALARAAGQRAGAVALADLPRLAQALVRVEGSAEFTFSGTIDPLGRPAARLRLRAMLWLPCDRCAAPVPVRIDEVAEFFFVENATTLARLPVEDTPEEPLEGSSHFNLKALIEDQLLLALPMSPRHRDCDVPATETNAAAGGETSPFAALEQLRVKRAKS
jgi:uncharacterized protein